MKLFGNKFSKFFLDIIFPIKCLSCQTEGEWLCSNCINKIRLYNFNSCPICGLENRDSSVCGYCKSISNLDGLLVVLEKTELTQKMIHYVKYNFVVNIFSYLKPKLKEYIIKNPNWRDFFVLTPVPLHRRRFLERGFNQSQIISNLINEISGNKINYKLLKKIKNNSHQVGLTADRRKLNMAGSFKIDYNFREDYKTPIIIVDDVYTTGSTIEECAKVLKEAGYQKVWGLVLVRG